ncbi:MAG: hypothetical protein IT293_02415 [Deltaproteobacteria bacterium]|nr:hypothetical protein [Deltaproteobacteria bacterium]
MGDHDLSSFQIDLDDVAVEEAHFADELPDRVRDVRDVEVARRHLVEHRREEEEVVAVDDRHLDGGITLLPTRSVHRLK